MVAADVRDVTAVATACADAGCVISALNGLGDVILDRQSVLIDAAVRAGVPRFIPSDFSADFTTKDDVATYKAAAAIDPTTPRVLRIAGDSLSVRDLARRMSETTGSHYRPLRAGGLVSMSAIIGVAQRLAPGDDAVLLAWQGMHHSRDMFGGRVRLDPLERPLSRPVVDLGP